jgi:hypothetical protein
MKATSEREMLGVITALLRLAPTVLRQDLAA